MVRPGWMFFSTMDMVPKDGRTRCWVLPAVRSSLAAGRLPAQDVSENTLTRHELVKTPQLPPKEKFIVTQTSVINMRPWSNREEKLYQVNLDLTPSLPDGYPPSNFTTRRKMVHHKTQDGSHPTRWFSPHKMVLTPQDGSHTTRWFSPHKMVLTPQDGFYSTRYSPPGSRFSSLRGRSCTQPGSTRKST